MSRHSRGGQAVILVVVATSIFILGALGLAIDGAHLFAQLQMAQVAADAAAQAGVMTMFDATPNGWTASDVPFNCSATDARSPCVYAQRNGFGGSGSSDVVHIDNPGNLPGVTVSSGTIPLRVTVTRTVKTTLIGLLGTLSFPIHASGVAAIVDVNSPVPILITHPTLVGSYSSSGNPTIKICGGPGRSIQINSTGTYPSSGNAVTTGSNTKVDLTHAGPLDTGDCKSGTGADFGTFGGPGAPPFTFSPGMLPGQYIQPSSPMPDPLAGISAPPLPAGAPAASAPNKTPLANGASGCPAAPTKSCNLYYPGYYPTGINVKLETAVFSPGIYYIASGGFTQSANGDSYMAVVGGTIPKDGITGEGMLIYDTGPSVGGRANTGGFSITANGVSQLLGSGCTFGPPASCDANNTYKGILMFEDHNAAAQTHTLQGGGAISLVGTLYLTNPIVATTVPLVPSMRATPAVYQTLAFGGNPGSSTSIQGEIITSALTMSGTPTITMTLSALPSYIVRQVALVK